MAILNGLEGVAHVIVEKDGTNWNGYILVEPDPGNIRYFDAFGPASKIIYEGPILWDGSYYFINGKAHTRNVHYVPGELRIDFKGIEPFNIVHSLQDKPSDYLP
jgi:hypothetical protein